MSDRMLRVNSTIREVLADEIERMNDSRLELVSVTGVDTSPNLREAVVYVDVLGEERREGALRALNGASKRLQSILGSQVRMKYTPTLEFRIDPGVTGGQRIEEILRELRDEDGTRGSDEEE
jgi:ribosome-binding factor A